jgi:oxaloacetate decarboxylase
VISIQERRSHLREVLQGAQCLTPASVYDALSAKLAEQAGFRLGMLAGSVASQSTLAAPDVNLLTLVELADQARRITRVSNLSLFVDADHGFGNALNVARTVEELEYAGVSGFSIEDTALPVGFGQALGAEALISLDEMLGKLRAAVAARRDPLLVLAGRTSALKVEDLAGALKRVAAIAQTGVDAVFLLGVQSIDQLAALRTVTSLPFILGSAPATLSHAMLAAQGTRILLQGHIPLAVAMKALRGAYQHLFAGGAPTALADQALSTAEIDAITNTAQVNQRKQDWLGAAMPPPTRTQS